MDYVGDYIRSFYCVQSYNMELERNLDTRYENYNNRNVWRINMDNNDR